MQGYLLTQTVEAQGLLDFCQPEFPGKAYVVDSGVRACSGAAVVSGNDDAVRSGFGHAYRNDTDAAFRDELHRDPCRRIQGTQIVDELCQVFDRIDVMMRRRRNKRNSGHSPAHTRYLCRDFVCRELTALAGLCPLCRFDLYLFRMDKIFCGDAETPRRDLPDAGTAIVQALFPLQGNDTRRIFSAFAAVGTSPAGIAGFSDGTVSFLTDGPEGYGRTDETPK